MISTQDCNFFERFLSPKDRGNAVHELAEMGEDAVPILDALFSGEAKNQFGSSYKNIGALHCGFVTVKKLGILAKPLEKFIREGIKNDNLYAIEAAGAMVELELETEKALARAVIRNKVGEAIYSLVRCGSHKRTEIISMLSCDEKIIEAIERTENFLKET